MTYSPSPVIKQLRTTCVRRINIMSVSNPDYGYKMTKILKPIIIKFSNMTFSPNTNHTASSNNAHTSVSIRDQVYKIHSLAKANHAADDSGVIVVPAIVTDGAPLPVGKDLHETSSRHVLSIQTNEDVVTVKVHRGGSGHAFGHNIRTGLNLC